MGKMIYAIKISDLVTIGLKVINVKIGQTNDIDSTLRQYQRGNPDAELLDLWESNNSLKSPYDCEKGIHLLAEKYAYERKKETFIFLQDAYQNFAENVNLLLRSITAEQAKRKSGEIKGGQKTDYKGTKPSLIMFCGKEYKVNSWREVLSKIIEEIYKEKRDFTPAFNIRGEKRIYFSTNPKGLFQPQKIKDANLFYEANLSANQIMRIIKSLLKVFGYSEQDLRVFF